MWVGNATTSDNAHTVRWLRSSGDRAYARSVLRRSATALIFATMLAACGDDDTSGTPDAGAIDAGPRDAGARDAGTDTGIEWPDAGPRYTGCELLDGAIDPDAGTSDTDAGAIEPLDPAGHPPLAGPGGPARAFTDAELLVACGYVNGGETDRDHHNTVLILDGYLWMPWAHEAGHGAISVFEADDPCNVVPIATTTDETIRETHAAGVAYIGGRRWMAVTALTGIQIWDITDATAPRKASELTLPGVRYPDSYDRVVMSISWQAPWMYVGAADNGIFVVDTHDPEAPVMVTQYAPFPEQRVGGVHAIGTLLVSQATEGSRTNLLDISSPTAPRAIPGGTFQLHDGTTDRFGRPRLMAAYFGHVNGDRAYYARHVIGGGLLIFDISDVTAPAFLGSYQGPTGSNGGYVFLKEGLAFVGLSNFAEIVDVTDPRAPSLVAHLEMTGDFDTPVPIGNVVFASVDADAVPGQATAVIPYAREPDRSGPEVNMIVPRDGEANVALSARVGMTFDEFVDLATVWRGSVQVREAGSVVPIDGTFSGQEGLVTFAPAAPLRPSTTYEVVVPPGGVRDVSGNPTASEFRATFTTTACP